MNKSASLTGCLLLSGCGADLICRPAFAGEGTNRKRGGGAKWLGFGRPWAGEQPPEAESARRGNVQSSEIIIFFVCATYKRGKTRSENVWIKTLGGATGKTLFFFLFTNFSKHWRYLVPLLKYSRLYIKRTPMAEVSAQAEAAWYHGQLHVRFPCSPNRTTPSRNKDTHEVFVFHGFRDL